GNTRYINMLLQLNNIPRIYNILAFISIYILLAGYIVFSSIFTLISYSSIIEAAAGKTYTGQTVLRAV
ncbi:uncharacterized protein BDZ99DRAFT_391174, partial [Mytilinidion resinicola]